MYIYTVYIIYYIHKIASIGDKIVKLKNVKTNVLQPLNIEKVRKTVIFAHCITCHSALGSNTDGDITTTSENIKSGCGQQSQGVEAWTR